MRESVESRSNNSFNSKNRNPEPQPESRVGAMLLIEDERLIRESLADVMFQIGVPTLAAANGSLGVDLYREHADSISLVFLDYLMPIMNGEQTFYELRKINPHVKVIFSSCNLQPDIQNRLQRENHIEFLPKPFNLKALLHKVEKVFAKEGVGLQLQAYA